MEDRLAFLLDVWREVCRAQPLQTSLTRAGALLRRKLPVAELVLAEPTAERPALTEWCRGDHVVHQQAMALTKQIPGLVPPGRDGDVLAVSLPHHEAPTALVLFAGPPARFDRSHESLLRELREPFAVAWANHCRLREIERLRAAAEADKRSLLTKLGREGLTDVIVGAEAGLAAVFQHVERVAPSDVPVLLLGETGSGKEVIARAVHAHSRCRGGAFLRVNCGAVPPELIDSELFGHEKGSFTGATATRAGWFERADGGTLFLDEVGELPPAAQVRLLRILQDGTFQRVGGERQLQVKVRVIAATHRDLPAMVAEGRFRQDLWYRLAVFPILLPPLRDRPDDIAALAAHFAQKAARRLGLRSRLPTPADVELLRAYPWPGNVRELAAVIERAAILGDGDRLEVAQALGLSHTSPPSRSGGGPAATEPFPTLDQAMSRHIEGALRRARGKVEGADGAAAILGVNPHTLRARMRKLGVDWAAFRRAS
ncbi:MAG: sigma-54 dependent transcriptional regulator [Gemmataceae bacterium]